MPILMRLIASKILNSGQRMPRLLLRSIKGINVSSSTMMKQPWLYKKFRPVTAAAWPGQPESQADHKGHTGGQGPKPGAHLGNVILERYMSDAHDHTHAPRAVASTPTLSLLRLSAVQRLAGAGLVLAALWLIVIATIGV